MPDINWDAVTAETVRHLQALIRLDTTNPPGNETLAADYLAGVLRAEGFDPLVLGATPARGNMIVRLKGTGAAPPLLIYSHTDVVPAEATQWSHPPYAAEIADGYVWGRGAADMKDTVAEQLMVMLLLKRQGVELKRDVIFAATADEEVAGKQGFGVAWLVKHHPDLLRAEFGLSEVGGYNMDLGGQSVYLIQVAEKGACWLKVRSQGRPGHGSLPHDDNAVAHLVRAVNGLLAGGLPYHLPAATATFLDAAAVAAQHTPLGPVFQQLRTPAGAARAFAGPLLGHSLQPFLYAMLHNTATPTGLAAGYKTNVIPSTAEATIDGRTLPGFDTERFLAELRPILGEHLSYEVLLETPPLEVSTDTPLFDLMVAGIQAHDPGALVVPYVMAAATDAKYLAPIGVPTYGFAPMQLPPDMRLMEMFHAHDERAPIAGLGWGVRVLYDVVRRYCTEAG